MSRTEIIEVPEAECAAFEARLLDLLMADAAKVGVTFARRDILLEARLDGRPVGGLSGKLGRAWMVVELLALSEEARGFGLGRALMARAEEITRTSGAIGIWLDTFTFQAPGFYERLGFTEFGRIPGYLDGHDRVFYARRFDGRA